MTYTLFVRPVNHVSQNHLSSLFKEYGEVMDIYIPRSHQSYKRKVFAYVKYDDKFAASRAIDGLDGKTINGKPIFVTWSTQMGKLPEEMEAQRIQREEARKKGENKSGFSEIERIRYLARESNRNGTIQEKYFTIVDYPPGVGEEFTPVFQRGLKPVGFRKTYFSWVYIPDSKVQQIIEGEKRHEACVARDARKAQEQAEV